MQYSVTLIFFGCSFPHFLMFSQECCLCNLRGGALKKTQNDKWGRTLFFHRPFHCTLTFDLFDQSVYSLILITASCWLDLCVGLCVQTDGLTWCAPWRCQRSGSATRQREAPSTPAGSPCSATNWWVDTRAHVHRHTCAHTDVVLEFPRSSRTGSL